MISGYCILSLIILLFGCSYTLTDEPKEPCIYDEEQLSATCEPCPKEEWIQLVLPKGDEKILNEDKTCFNNDPIQMHHATTGSKSFHKDEVIVLGRGPYRTAGSKSGKGKVLVQKQGFFRYAYDPSFEGKSYYLDLDDNEKYFYRDDKEDTSFQIVEWPGRTFKKETEAMEQKARESLPLLCTTNYKFANTEACKTEKFWMLNVHRNSGKIQFYPCNKQEGTNIVAVASLTKYISPSGDNAEDCKETDASCQKLWLSHGRESIYNNYIQPLFLPTAILDQMVKNEGEDCLKEERYEQLRAVMDFVFTRHRLVIGMKCGIVLVSQLDKDELQFGVSVLLAETGSGTNLFPGPINKLSSSACCALGGQLQCNNELVAAYSYKANREEDEDKFIYVSFDLGDNFEKKIVSTRHSPVNLISALYKLYEKWDDYYEIMNNPDEDDLEEDDEMLKDLRMRPEWDSITTTKKETLLAFGVPREEKLVTSLKKIVEILENRVPKRRERLKEKGVDVNKYKTPEWVQYQLNNTRNAFGWEESWTDENCDGIPECNENFEDDRAVKWLFGDAEDIKVKTPKRNENEIFCKELISILVLPEESHLMAVCEIGFGKQGSARRKRQSSGDESKSLALFNFPVKKNIPIIYNYRISQRIFSCKYMKNTMEMGRNSEDEDDGLVLPEIFRIRGTGTLFIVNCEGSVYLSTNFGNTVFNSVFYYEKEIMNKYCKNKIELASSECAEGRKSVTEGQQNNSPTYIRSYHLCGLDVPPLIAAGKSGSVLLMTFGKFYAHGAISYNTEARLVVGETIKEFEEDRKFENLVFPGISSDGEAGLAINLKQTYSIPDTVFSNKLYSSSHSMRLVRLPFLFQTDSQNFFSENLAMCPSAIEKGFELSECKTTEFLVNPLRLSMDINEEKEVMAMVKDDNPSLPLWIFSGNERSVEVKANLIQTDSSASDLSLHRWLVTVRSTPNRKLEGESLVDAFFGANYNKLNDYSTQVTLVNSLALRCHVQPTATVNVEIGCNNGKRLVAHEDKHRPQCKEFRENFNFTLKKGEFDPDMVRYWIDNKDGKQVVQLLDNGDIKVTYDYSKWGCPLEPYRAYPFIPDLRIVDDMNPNSVDGRKFEGKFILIELFGSKGYEYSKTVRDFMTEQITDEKEKCNIPPQNLAELTKRWKWRKRLFDIASKRLKFPHGAADLDGKNISEIVSGNHIFINNAVKEPINIWNRANFIKCQEKYKNEDGDEEEENEEETEEDDDDDEDEDAWKEKMLAQFPEEVLDREYEVMTTRQITDDEDDEHEDSENNDEFTFEGFSEEEELDEDTEEETLNKINWNIKDHQRVYLFLAVAVDDIDSLCTYSTIFGVSLKKSIDMDDLASFLVFLLFMLFWTFLITGGYFARKRILQYSYIRQAKGEKLEQAAWTIVYRYEKLIHGRTMQSVFRNTMYGDAADADPQNIPGKLNAVAKKAYDKRLAELRMKKTHILAQEQARYERLQKIFQKQ